VRTINAATRELAAVGLNMPLTPMPNRRRTGLYERLVIETNTRIVSLRFARHNKSARQDGDDEEEEEEEDAHVARFEDTGEGPFLETGRLTRALAVPIPIDAPLPPTFEIGKLKSVVDVSLPMTSLQFFQVFVGDKASAGLPEFHREFGDENVVASPWSSSVEEEGKPKDHDEYDFEGFERVPERVLTFRAQTNAHLGPAVTRAVKKLRYWWYQSTSTLVLKAATRSLDVPMGDTFVVVEVWLIQPVEDGRIRVRILMDVPFSKSSMLKSTIQAMVAKGAAKM